MGCIELPCVGWVKSFVRHIFAGNSTAPPFFVMHHGTLAGGGGNDGSNFPMTRCCLLALFSGVLLQRIAVAAVLSR
jgi:hypothetical protein